LEGEDESESDFSPGRKETRWECKQCSNIPLHPEGCFEIFRTKRNY
jgi:hypothetical protein